MDITDDMCRRAIEAMAPDRIQGFSSPQSWARSEWGAPHYILDTHKPPGQRELWRGDSHDEMQQRCEIERVRLGLAAAFSANNRTTEK